MFGLRDRLRILLIRVTARVIYGRTPRRWCPFCDAPSMLRSWMWRRIEARDEEIPCPDCFKVPRLWSTEVPR